MPRLRPYQQQDVDNLSALLASGCFNEQRTGKTPTSIMVMKAKQVRKLIVVCPASAIYPWVEAFEEWDGRPAIPLVGTPAARQKALTNWKSGAVVISYGCLKATARGEGMVKQLLAHTPDGLIVDEAHRLKDPASAQSKAVFACIHIPNRLLLTGTPASGKPEDIFSILHMIDPKKFNSYWKFIAEYFQTQQGYGFGGRTYTDVVGFKPGMDTVLQQWLADYSTQRKRKDVMPWLPAKNYEDIKLPLTIQQKKYLSDLQKYYETEHVVTQGTLDRLIRYRQVCQDPMLLGLPSVSPKTEWLLEYLQDYPEVPTLVFTKFTSFIQRIKEKLEIKKIRYGEIVGATSSKDRAKLVEAFQTGKLKLLLLNIDAAKEALTLDKAETTVFLDQYPPASDIAQAEDRFVATTEAGKDKPHRIIRVMMKDSYDERIYQMIAQNAAVIDLLNDYHKYLSKKGE